MRGNMLSFAQKSFGWETWSHSLLVKSLIKGGFRLLKPLFALPLHGPIRVYKSPQGAFSSPTVTRLP